MASQRIVLTSPWKLGLFVFLLVAATGFGLLYSYIELFGGQIEVVSSNLKVLDTEIQLQGNLTVRDAYIVMGAVAMMSLIGYLGVITSARPLDRVVRGSRAREQALKKFGGVRDPRDCDPEDFDSEPILVHALERWATDAQMASDAQLQVAAQREALARLSDKVQIAGADGIDFNDETVDPAVNALVESINQYVVQTARSAEQRASETNQAPAVAEPIGGAQNGMGETERAAATAAIQSLSGAEAELEGFVESVARRASRLAQATQALGQSDQSGAVNPPAVLQSATRTGQRLTELRQSLEVLAEEANKLAITMALQISRLGDEGNEMLGTAEELRGLSTRYQRLASDLRVCEEDHSATMQQLQQGGGGAPSSDRRVLEAFAQESMVLDQNAEALREVLGQLRSPIADLRTKFDVPEPTARYDTQSTKEAAPIVPPVSASGPAEAASAPTPTHEEPMPQTSTPTQPAAPLAAEAADGSRVNGERVYEIAELGGREVDENGDVIHDLQEFGAVEL